MADRGAIAAGHPKTAETGATVLKDGGNAVDAAVAAVLASFATESGLTALGGGGYMLVSNPPGAAEGGGGSTLLDFFVEAPGRGGDETRREELVPLEISFGDAVQIFNVGPASVGVYGAPAGIAEAVRRWGSMTLEELCAPAARLAREGVALTDNQAWVLQILHPILTSTPEVSALYAPTGRLAVEGDVLVNPELADALERFGRDGPAPFYDGDVADAVVDWLAERGGMLTREDLRSYRAVAREPVNAAYRGRQILTNPPPAAGGILIAYAMALLEREPSPPPITRVVETMERVQTQRTMEFMDGLSEEGFLDRFTASRMGSTTHISVIDAAGMSCSVTCSNGEGSGIVVPGTGIHLNNMMGEQDLNPHGFHQHPPGRRMPSMMSPTAVLADGVPELVLGSGGSNRIRSAILQTIAAVIDDGMPVQDAVRAPRVHFEDGVVYAEPGVDTGELEASGRAISRFRSLNLFFGGVHAVARDPATGALTAGGDPRRGGAAVVV